MKTLIEIFYHLIRRGFTTNFKAGEIMCGHPKTFSIQSPIDFTKEHLYDLPLPALGTSRSKPSFSGLPLLFRVCLKTLLIPKPRLGNVEFWLAKLGLSKQENLLICFETLS